MPNRLLQLLVFTSGLSVMAVEMTGLRLLAPYFGTSLLVTTALIGTLMAFLALGYALGGRVGDRKPTLDALCRMTTISAAMVRSPSFSRSSSSTRMIIFPLLRSSRTSSIFEIAIFFNHRNKLVFFKTH